MSRFSIVIPVYNREALVCRTLDSIAAQSRPDLIAEVIAVDNNSADGSRAAIESWGAEHPDIPLRLLDEPTPGAAAARNRGLASASADWVIFFDSDDEMLPRHLERAAEAIAAHPEADAIGWDIEIVNLDGTRTIKRFVTRDLLYCNIFHGPMGTQRYCVKAEAVRAAGGWNPTVMGWNDIELANRMILRGLRIAYAGPEITVRVHAVAESITGTCFHRSAAIFDHSIDCIAQALPPDKRHYAQLKRVILAACCTREGHPEIGRQLLDKALAATPSATRRAILRLAYAYTRRSGRGIARIIKPLMT